MYALYSSGVIFAHLENLSGGIMVSAYRLLSSTIESINAGV